MFNYNAPNTTPSTIDAGQLAPNTSEQMRTFHYLKKAIITARKDQYFMPLAPVIDMPKHMGKEIRIYEYIPLLDDRNVNDQGIDAAGVAIVNGNLYGSSKDIGTITARLPALTENGGRVNRVGFSRIMRSGTLHKFGFFMEFTQESIDFDSDDMLMDHLSRELLNGAVQLTEAVLQIDLLNSAGVIHYAGAATQDSEMTGEGATPSVVDYADLMRVDQILTDNRTPRHTKIISGSRNIDTRVLPSARIMYVGSELTPLLRTMEDSFENPAFIPIQHYAEAGTILNGEVGSIGFFRVIEVPEMLHWADAGGAVTTNPGYRESGGNYNIYPILIVGDDSFSTIGFQSQGKTVNFTIMTKMPGRETADRNDPYGETGFSSIKWYYGFLAKRPERIAVIKTLAPL